MSDLEEQRAKEEQDNPISHSRKAWGFVLGGMFFVAIINVIIGLWSFPFEAQERDRQRQSEEPPSDAGVGAPPDAPAPRSTPR